MKRNTVLIAGAAIVAASALGVGGAALANAGAATAPAGALTGSGYGAPGYGGPAGGGDRRGGGLGQTQGLSGETAVKVVEAAVAKEPTAAVLRMGKADDGSYRVAMRRTDGTHVVLTLDANYAVTGTEERAAKAPRQRTATPTPSTTS